MEKWLKSDADMVLLNRENCIKKISEEEQEGFVWLFSSGEKLKICSRFSLTLPLQLHDVVIPS